MARPEIDREKAVRTLIAAQLTGDAKAAESAKVTVRTLQNWRRKLASDPELVRAFAEKRAEVIASLDARFRAFLGSAVAKLEELVSEATVEHIHEVAGAIKIVGELTTTRAGLGMVESEAGETSGGQPSPDRQGQATPQAPRGDVIPIRGVKTSAAE
jgi:hypothetical protein